MSQYVEHPIYWCKEHESLSCRECGMEMIGWFTVVEDALPLFKDDIEE